jgi:hypothetical protein
VPHKRSIASKRSRLPWLAAALAAMALTGLAVWLTPVSEVSPAAPQKTATSAPRALPVPFSQIGAAAPGRAQRLRELVAQYQLADHTFCSYRDASRYPSSSRPITEHPDQVYPNAPVLDSHPMRKQGGATEPAIVMQTSQSRVYLGALDSAAFSLRALDATGKPTALQVTRASASGITFKGQRPSASVTLAFLDDGRNGDAQAGDGAYSAVLVPARSALAGFNGTIRTEVNYSVNGRAGTVLFDVIYTPEVPAVWAGPIRDALENGSLVYILRADIRQPGRYIVSGRVDDAGGKPVALATFNEVLAAGPQEIRLTVFGKLLHDLQPAMPLTLRDVDAYLLKQDTDPDRALMVRLEGAAHVSKRYALASFSDDQWQSEERSRYLTEYGNDLEAARAALGQISPGAALPPSECK